MYFKNKSTTNIDNEFKNNNNFNLLDFLKNKKIFLIIALLIIISIIVIIFITSNKKDINITYLTLKGDETITIYQNSTYSEPGYNAYNKNQENLTNNVKINSNLNTALIGEYQITYTIDNVTKIRNIKVIQKPKDYTYIYLNSINNNITIYLKVGEKYQEPGYIVFSNDDDLTNKVTITGNVDTSKKGIYKLTYSVVDSKGVTVSKTREVHVLDTEISLTLNNKEYTNNDVIININIIDDLFDYLLLPNGNKITTTNYSYTVSVNGTYKFKAFDKRGNQKEASISVNNIDKTAPTGSCSGTYGAGKSIININAKDNIGIKKYEINGTDYTSNKITLNKELTNVTINIYDKANNKNTISCTLKATYDKPIEASGNNVIKNLSTNTLKVWIEEYSTYYVSHIWALAPYKQFKSAIPDNFGKELKTSNSLLTKEINNRNLQNKVIVAVNASGIVKNGVWDTHYYTANPAWNLTSVSPIVIVDGKVIRDISNGKIPSSKHITYGLKKDGNLEYYQYQVGTNLQTNIDTSNKIIKDGVLYTFAFNPVLVLNNKTVSTDTSPNIRQGFCQIDKNNFVFITNKANRNTGFSFKSLGDYMVKLGCKTGFNLDGGGSASLLLKDSSNEITTIANSSRQIADIVYFHE